MPGDFSSDFSSDFGTALTTFGEFRGASKWASILGLVLPTSSNEYPSRSLPGLFCLPASLQYSFPALPEILKIYNTDEDTPLGASWVEYGSLQINPPEFGFSKWMVWVCARIWSSSTGDLTEVRVQKNDATTLWSSTRSQNFSTERYVHQGMFVLESVDAGTTLDLDMRVTGGGNGTVEGYSLIAIRLDVLGAEYSFVQDASFDLDNVNNYSMDALTHNLGVGKYFVGVGYNQPNTTTASTNTSRTQIQRITSPPTSTRYIAPNRVSELYRQDFKSTVVYDESLFVWNVMNVQGEFGDDGEWIFRTYMQCPDPTQTCTNGTLVVMKLTGVYDFEFLEQTGATTPIDTGVYEPAFNLFVPVEEADYVVFGHARGSTNEVGPLEMGLQIRDLPLNEDPVTTHFRAYMALAVQPPLGFIGVRTLSKSPSTNFQLRYTGFTTSEEAFVTDMRILLLRIPATYVKVLEGEPSIGQPVRKFKFELPNGVVLYGRSIPPEPVFDEEYYQTHFLLKDVDGNTSVIDESHEYFKFLDKWASSGTTYRVMTDLELDEFDSTAGSF